MFGYLLHFSFTFVKQDCIRSAEEIEHLPLSPIETELKTPTDLVMKIVTWQV
jgi:hypothetical protein